MHKHLKGVELHSTACTNHQNFYKKSKKSGKILQPCHVLYVTEAFKKTHTTFKALDIVINNAGILYDSRWELEIAINLVS